MAQVARGVCVSDCVWVCAFLCGWFRYVGGGRLDDLLTQSPHTPVAGCTTTFGRDGRVRKLLLTDSSHNFVAWIAILDGGNDNAGQADRQTDRQTDRSAGQMSCVCYLSLALQCKSTF